MKKILIGLILAFVCGIGVQTDAATVSKIVGLNAECDTNNAGCFPFPVSGATICHATLNQATCPRIFHPSWVSGSRLWGVSGTNAAACVTSTNLGSTWVACTAQAFVPIQQEVAETSNGNIVAVADVGGTCTIRLSTDSTVTWNTVFTNPGIGCGVGTGGQLLYCQQSGGQCDFGAGSRTYRTLDNGVTWAATNHGGTASISNGIEMHSASIGAFGGALATGSQAVYSSAGTFVASTAWPGSAVGYFGAYPLMFGASPQYINGNGTAVWARTDADGNVIQTFTPVNATGIGAVVNPGLRATLWSGSQYYIAGPRATGLGIWITTDNFVSSNLIFQSTVTGTSTSRYTMYKLSGKILISVNDGGTVGAFFIVS
jgi:hypothetical protein